MHQPRSVTKGGTKDRRPNLPVNISCGKADGGEYNNHRRDVAQLGSALPWGGRGHGFESRRSDHFRRNGLGVIRQAFFIALPNRSANVV